MLQWSWYCRYLAAIKGHQKQILSFPVWSQMDSNSKGQFGLFLLKLFWPKPTYLFICFNCSNLPLRVRDMCRRKPVHNLKVLFHKSGPQLRSCSEKSFNHLLITIYWIVSKFKGIKMCKGGYEKIATLQILTS